MLQYSTRSTLQTISHSRKMINNGFAVVLLLGILCSLTYTSADFPDDPKPCKYGDSQCIAKIIDFLLNEKNKGDSSINLVETDPIRIPIIHIKQGDESPLNIDLKFTDNLVLGLKDSVTFQVKGFGKDLTKNHALHLKIKSISLVGDYTINGKVLILPVSGTGKSNVTLTNAEMVIRFVGTPVEKNGDTYMTVNDLKFDFKAERIHYDFQNLFNGDKALGDNMNLFLNENWMEIYKESRESMSNALSKVIQGVINNVFENRPYDKYFTE